MDIYQDSSGEERKLMGSPKLMYALIFQGYIFHLFCFAFSLQVMRSLKHQPGTYPKSAMLS